MTEPFHVGQRVRIRPEYKRVSDFDEAIVARIDTHDQTIDVTVDGQDWGQWFSRLDDGTYEIEPVPVCVNCGTPIEHNDELGWIHSEECPEDSPCWSGEEGATPEQNDGSGAHDADYLRKQAIDEIMWVATFDTVEEQRDALNSAYSAGYYDAQNESSGAQS
jgi:hypothetical protein